MLLRPRTTGEILDDAWRLARGDATVLLALNGLFLAPAFSVVLLLLARPAPASLPEKAILPAAAAALLALTGLASGACQEHLRCRADGQVSTLAACLTAAWRRSLGHCTIRMVAVASGLLGLGCLIMPGLLVWMAAAPAHAALAASKTGSLREVQLGREARCDGLKAAGVVLGRVPLLLIVVLNLVLVLNPIGLWIAGNLAGLDVGLVQTQLTASNPLFLLALTFFAWLLLAPFFEASNFLLHLDTRIRQEGLDLQHRVQRVFPTSAARRAVGALLAMGLLPALAAPTMAAIPAEVIQEVRARLTTIRKEVQAADPYPGGARWQERLDDLADKLDHVAPGRYRWFEQALEGFADRMQTAAVEVLTDLEQRLAVLEESLAQPRPAAGRPGRDIKNLLRPGFEDGAAPPPGEHQKKEKKDQEAPKKAERPPDDAPAVRRHGDRGMIAPVSGGPGHAGWLILAGLGTAVLVAALVLWLRRPRRPAQPTAPGAPAVASEAPPAPHEQAPLLLFRQAEAMAAAARYPEAVRALYHAVLSLLHRRQWLRYETTRTNGEYVRQLRLAVAAPAELHEIFAALTGRFDSLWYGEQGCGSADYAGARASAVRIRQLAEP